MENTAPPPRSAGLRAMALGAASSQQGGSSAFDSPQKRLAVLQGGSLQQGGLLQRTPRAGLATLTDNGTTPLSSRRALAVRTPNTATRTRTAQTRLPAALSDDSNIQVIVRVRPPAGPELTGHPGARCVVQDAPQSLYLMGSDKAGAEPFTFDHVAGERATQVELFELAGRPIVENCLAGYNSTIFAYGQTGSGKTFTMFGSDVDKADLLRWRLERADVEVDRKWGMIPRVFQLAFALMQQEVQQRAGERLSFICSCSFLEIYNEQIHDLLDPKRTNLQIREAPTGVFVENLTKQAVSSFADVMELIQQGAKNRKVAGTNMNRESSRSHSVFTCNIESTWTADGISNRRFGQLNLVDLAGSERQKSSGAVGERLREASSINKSLSHLGHVIMVLVEALKDNRQHHVPYRDSVLTFLLQDSLGGNSKTTMIACISPFSGSINETRGTLKFAQRAKLVHNKAVVNEASDGEKGALKKEIARLKDELYRLRKLCTCEAALLLPSSSSPPFSLPHAHTTTPTTPHQPSSSAAAAAGGAAGSSTAIASAMQERLSSPRHLQLLGEIKRLEVSLAGALRRERDLDRQVDNLKAENASLRKQLAAAGGVGAGGSSAAVVGGAAGLGREEVEEGRLATVVEGEEEVEEGGGLEVLDNEMADLKEQVVDLLAQKAAAGGGDTQERMEQLSRELQGAREELERCKAHLRLSDDANARLARQTQEMGEQLARLAAERIALEEQLSSLNDFPIKGGLSSVKRARGDFPPAATPARSAARAAAPHSLIPLPLNLNPTPLVTTTRGARAATPASVYGASPGVGMFGFGAGMGVTRNLEEEFSSLKGFQTPQTAKGKGAAAAGGTAGRTAGGTAGGTAGRVGRAGRGVSGGDGAAEEGTGGDGYLVDCRSSLRHVDKDQDRFRQHKADLDSAIKRKFEVEWANSALKLNIKLQEQEAKQLAERIEAEEGRRREAERAAEEAERAVREAGAEAEALARGKAAVEEQLRVIQAQVRELQGREERSEDERRDLEEALRKERDLGEEATQLAEAEWQKRQEATARRGEAERSLQRTRDEAKKLRSLLDDSEETRAKYVRLKHELRGALQRLVEAAEGKVEDERRMEGMREELVGVRAQLVGAVGRAEEAERRVRAERRVQEAQDEVEVARERVMEAEERAMEAEGRALEGEGDGEDELVRARAEIVILRAALQGLEAEAEAAGGRVTASEAEANESELVQAHAEILILQAVLEEADAAVDSGKAAMQRALAAEAMAAAAEAADARAAAAEGKVVAAEARAEAVDARVTAALAEAREAVARAEVLVAMMESEECEAIRANAEVMLLEGILEGLEVAGESDRWRMGGLVRVGGERGGEGRAEGGDRREELESELARVREELEEKREEVRRREAEVEEGRRQVEEGKRHVEEVRRQVGEQQVRLEAWEDTWVAWENHRHNLQFPGGTGYDMGVRYRLGRVVLELAQRELRRVREAGERAEEERREADAAVGRTGREIRVLVEENAVLRGLMGLEEGDVVPVPGKGRRESFDLAIGAIGARIWAGRMRERELEEEEGRVEKERREVEGMRREVEERRKALEEEMGGEREGRLEDGEGEESFVQEQAELEGTGQEGMEAEGVGQEGIETGVMEQEGMGLEKTWQEEEEGEGARPEGSEVGGMQEGMGSDEGEEAGQSLVDGHAAEGNGQVGLDTKRDEEEWNQGEVESRWEKEEEERRRAEEKQLRRASEVLDKRGAEMDADLAGFQRERVNQRRELERMRATQGLLERERFVLGGGGVGLGLLDVQEEEKEKSEEEEKEREEEDAVIPLLFSVSRSQIRRRMSLSQEGVRRKGMEEEGELRRRGEEVVGELVQKEEELKQLVLQVEELQAENALLRNQLSASDAAVRGSLAALRTPARAGNGGSRRRSEGYAGREAAEGACTPVARELGLDPILEAPASAGDPEVGLGAVEQLKQKALRRHQQVLQKDQELRLLRTQLDILIHEKEKSLVEMERVRSEAVKQRSMADKCMQKDLVLSQENAQLKQNLASIQQRLEQAEGELQKLVGQQNLNQRIQVFAKFKEEANELRGKNSELQAELKRLGGRVKRLEGERSRAGCKEKIDYDEEARLQQRLEEVERCSTDMAQKLLTVCRAVLQVTETSHATSTATTSPFGAGQGLDNRSADGSTSSQEKLGADPSAAALAALSSLKFCLKAADDEISDLKFQARMAAEKAELSALREQNSLGDLSLPAQVLSPPLPSQFMGNGDPPAPLVLVSPEAPLQAAPLQAAPLQAAPLQAAPLRADPPPQDVSDVEMGVGVSLPL